jgi:outer membrane immunogenic protein
MRRLVLAAVFAMSGVASASAADLPARPILKAPPQVPAYSWVGFYAGVHVGGGWADKHWVDTTLAPLDEGSHTARGWLAGGQVGYNMQAGAWVYGIEIQASAADLRGNRQSPVFPTDDDRSRVDALGTIAARLGYAWDRSLLYAKAGVAWAHDRFSIRDIPTNFVYANFDQVRWGWMVGAGLEYALMQNWSAKIEYNYMDLGTGRSTNVLCIPNNFGCVGPGGSFNEDVTQRVHVVKGGLNYRFGGPLVARY